MFYYSYNKNHRKIDKVIHFSFKAALVLAQPSLKKCFSSQCCLLWHVRVKSNFCQSYVRVMSGSCQVHIKGTPGNARFILESCQGKVMAGLILKENFFVKYLAIFETERLFSLVSLDLEIERDFRNAPY